MTAHHSESDLGCWHGMWVKPQGWYFVKKYNSRKKWWTSRFLCGLPKSEVLEYVVDLDKLTLAIGNWYVQGKEFNVKMRERLPSLPSIDQILNLVWDSDCKKCNKFGSWQVRNTQPTMMVTSVWKSGPVRFFAHLRGQPWTGPVHIFQIFYATVDWTGINRSVTVA
jgi:hypothetical protein